MEFLRREEDEDDSGDDDGGDFWMEFLLGDVGGGGEGLPVVL